MSMIDTQNARQIRDPMDVLITMELPDEGVTLTYSGYSTAKVADGELGEMSWPMRQIADLQGEGFPLDGSHVLYNPTTPASTEYGKIGVRSNIGETVTVTVTANRSVASLTIFATGASSVEYNGQTAAIVGGSVVIPVGATTVTLTFNPVSETERIEVSDITAGTTFRITNDSLIKAVVSLRSDLSPFGQTLPESEINIDVYQDADISDVVAAIPEDTPITYQAGYPGDMSPVRKFYVSGQVTWADNVLHIQGVDAVHFLDNKEFGAPVYFDSLNTGLINSAKYVLDKAGVQTTTDSRAYPGGECMGVIPKGINFREHIAFLNQAFNVTNREGYLLAGGTRLPWSGQFAYVDAGMPHIRTLTPLPSKIIYEDDCSSVNRHVEVQTTTTTGKWTAFVSESDPFKWIGDSADSLGTATWVKDVGVSLNFDRIGAAWAIGVPFSESSDKIIDAGYTSTYGSGSVLPLVPTDSSGHTYTGYRNGYIYHPDRVLPRIRGVGLLLICGDIIQSEYQSYPQADSYALYSSFIPWDQRFEMPDGWDQIAPVSGIMTQAQVWDIMVATGVFASSASSVDLDISGTSIDFTSMLLTYTAGSGGGATFDYGSIPIYGRAHAYLSGGGTVELYPWASMSTPMYRSNVTGSFRWKGDPRLQPRDVVNFERLDGTQQEITLENITITHEGGGTYADITYREGVI